MPLSAESALSQIQCDYDREIHFSSQVQIHPLPTNHILKYKKIGKNRVYIRTLQSHIKFHGKKTLFVACAKKHNFWFFKMSVHEITSASTSTSQNRFPRISYTYVLHKFGTLVENTPIVPVRLGHSSRFTNRDQQIGINASPGSATNRDEWVPCGLTSGKTSSSTGSREPIVPVGQPVLINRY